MGKGKKRKGKAGAVSLVSGKGDELRLGSGTEPSGGLEVHVEGDSRTYHIPSINELSLGDVMAFRKVNKLPKKQRNDAYTDAFYDLCIRHVPRAAIDSLTMGEFAALVEAWNETNEDGGAGSGE
jgi:hypothetical protein